LGHFAPLSFPAYGDKIQATRFAGGRWLGQDWIAAIKIFFIDTSEI
jgi:hypothetical protein